MTFNLNREKLVESLIQKFKMGKLSKFLLNSALVASVYGNSFSVRSCNDDSDVSINFTVQIIMQFLSDINETVETKNVSPRISVKFNSKLRNEGQL